MKWYLLGCVSLMLSSLQGAARNPGSAAISLIGKNGILYYEEGSSPCLSGFTCAIIHKGAHKSFKRKAKNILGGEIKSWNWKKRGLIVLAYPANTPREELLKEAKCFDNEWGYSNRSKEFDIILFRESDLSKRESVVALCRETLGLR